MKKIFKILPIILIFCIIFAGCGKEQSLSQSSVENSAQIAVSSQPVLAEESSSNIAKSLNASDSKTEITPSLANSEQQPKSDKPIIDFAELQKKNPDIYAWIKIPGTNIDYPILQHPSEDNYYISYTLEHKKYVKGAIYTQLTYNSKDFEDNHTVIYGHNMFRSDGDMFSQLTKFQNKEFFDDNREIIIYMPDKEIKYKIFATYKWSDEHLLYSYQTQNATMYGNYLETIFNNRDLSANIDKTMKLTSDDKIITLSTCVSLNGPQRLLVQAVKLDD